MEACEGLQGNLRHVGARNVAGSVHHGTDYLLELSENQQSHNQHHIDLERMRVKVGQVMERECAGGRRKGGVIGIEDK